MSQATPNLHTRLLYTNTDTLIILLYTNTDALIILLYLVHTRCAWKYMLCLSMQIYVGMQIQLDVLIYVAMAKQKWLLCSSYFAKSIGSVGRKTILFYKSVHCNKTLFWMTARLDPKHMFPIVSSTSWKRKYQMFYFQICQAASRSLFALLSMFDCQASKSKECSELHLFNTYIQIWQTSWERCYILLWSTSTKYWSKLSDVSQVTL